MKHFNFSSAAKKIFSTLFILSALLCMSCQTEPTSENLFEKIENLSADSVLIGKWIDSFNSVYEISESELSNFDEENGIKTYDSYAGNNLNIIKLTEESGYIYIQYTRAPDKDWNYTTDKNLAPDVGKWYALSYKNLTQNSVQISGAYKIGGRTSCETLEEAVKEFTIENGYFAGCSDCVKK